MEKALKKRRHGLQIAYVTMATLYIPFNFLLLLGLSSYPNPGINEDTAEALFTAPIIMYFIISFIYVVTFIVLAILNIIQSFKAFNQRDTLFCINGMLILKYGMVIFFASNFLYITLTLLGLGIFGMLISHGTLIFTAPILLPFLIAIILFLLFIAWLIMLPGSIFSIQVIRLSRLEKKIGSASAFFHGLLQFLFLTDVLDTMYLALVKWRRGKKSSIVISFFYLFCIVESIWTCIKIWNVLNS